MIGRTNAGAGSFGLNIVTGKTAPVSPIEDMIWIKSDESITDIYVNPNNIKYENGCAYIAKAPNENEYVSVGSSYLPRVNIGNRETSMTFKRRNIALDIKLNQGYVYSDNKIRYAAAFVFRNGAWQRISFGLVLVYSTGFSNAIYSNMIISTKDSTGNITSNTSGGIVFKSYNVNSEMAVSSKSRCNLSCYSKIFFEMNLENNPKGVIFGITSDSVSYSNARDIKKYIRYTTVESIGKNVIELNVSGVVGEYYVVCSLNGASGNINKIYCE